MTKQDYTEVIVVLDRSGSMAPIAKDLEWGFNDFIGKQRLLPGECKVSLYQFDTEHELVYQSLSVDKVPPLNLVPRGGTALYDAFARAMLGTGTRLAAMPEPERPSKVLFVVITDGDENSSVEYSRQAGGALRIRTMITHQENQYNWAFLYLGAQASTFKDAQDIGIRNVSVYMDTHEGAASMTSAFSNSVSSYRSAPVGAKYDSYAPPALIVPDNDDLKSVRGTMTDVKAPPGDSSGGAV
jgi:hypothetical protein